VEYTEKHLRDFLELLQEHRSEDAKKARRNISVIGFVIVVVYALGVKLTQIKVLGVDVSESNEISVLVISGGLVCYWMFVFLVLLVRDRTIQAERKRQFESGLVHLKKVYDENEEWNKVTKGQPNRSFPYNYGGVKDAYESYLSQKKRTRWVKRCEAALKFFEVVIPIILGCGAIFFLLNNVFALVR
jgi:hypothetical protein